MLLFPAGLCASPPLGVLRMSSADLCSPLWPRGALKSSGSARGVPLCLRGASGMTEMVTHRRGRGAWSPVGSRNIRKHIPWLWGGGGERGRDWSLSAPSDGLATAQGRARSARPSSRGILMLRAPCVWACVCWWWWSENPGFDVTWV